MGKVGLVVVEVEVVVVLGVLDVVPSPIQPRDSTIRSRVRATKVFLRLGPIGSHLILMFGLCRPQVVPLPGDPHGDEG